MLTSEINEIIGLEIAWRVKDASGILCAVFENCRSRAQHDNEHRQICFRVLDRVVTLHDARKCGDAGSLQLMVTRYYDEVAESVRKPQEKRPRDGSWARRIIEPVKRYELPGIPDSEQRRKDFVDNRSFLRR